jgi:acyl-CoA reductase-like NAD-dependent aldehyde dehydrogenase
MLFSQFLSEAVVFGSPQLAIATVACFVRGDAWVADLSKEIIGLLNVLKAREELDELTRLFEESSQAWQHLTEDERSRLIARAAALMADSKI